ncbi:MAG: hypothetical protein M1828_005554 [Chrysothrix sp. TS-e1954]|nr:MAG: hypothetical protein M1828_005554 [Chrysothrix sp. TS-e1954]
MSWSSISKLVARVYEPPWTSPIPRWMQYYDTVDQVVPRERRIHGFVRLRPGFVLAHVPYDAVVRPLVARVSTKKTFMINRDADVNPCQQGISWTYSGPKTIVAIVQLVFAMITLYRASGTELQQYGFTAYSLTVTPFALMSVINLCGTLITPSFPSLYIVGSTVSDEALQRGCTIDGMVARLGEEDVSVENAQYECGLVRATFTTFKNNPERFYTPGETYTIHQWELKQALGAEDLEHRPWPPNLRSWQNLAVSLTPHPSPVKQDRVLKFDSTFSRSERDSSNRSPVPDRNFALAVHETNTIYQ